MNYSPSFADNRFVSGFPAVHLPESQPEFACRAGHSSAGIRAVLKIAVSINDAGGFRCVAGSARTGSAYGSRTGVVGTAFRSRLVASHTIPLTGHVCTAVCSAVAAIRTYCIAVAISDAGTLVSSRSWTRPIIVGAYPSRVDEQTPPLKGPHSPFADMAPHVPAVKE